SSAQNIQLRYFNATFYKKGTCHIEFTNEDVLKSFNLFASQKKSWLPPSYGKKSYRDMSAADKKVVDSFEGEASYTDNLARGLIPTTKTLLRLGECPARPTASPAAGASPAAPPGRALMGKNPATKRKELFMDNKNRWAIYARRAGH